MDWSVYGWVSRPDTWPVFPYQLSAIASDNFQIKCHFKTGLFSSSILSIYVVKHNWKYYLFVQSFQFTWLDLFTSA